MAETAPVPVVAAEEAAAPARTGWGMFKSVLLQIVIFYFISSFFRGRQTAPPPTNSDGTPSLAGQNLFHKDEKLVCSNFSVMRLRQLHNIM